MGQECPAQYGAAQDNVKPPLYSKELSPQDGPGSWKGLSSLRCGQLGTALRAAFLRVHCRDGGFLNPLVAGCVWPVSNSQGSAGRKPVSASQHEAKHGFHILRPGAQGALFE